MDFLADFLGKKANQVGTPRRPLDPNMYKDFLSEGGDDDFDSFIEAFAEF